MRSAARIQLNFSSPLNSRELELWLRIPFKDGGRDNKGCDCWGLIRLIYGHRGVELPTYGEIAAKDLIRVRSQISSDKGHSQWDRVVLGSEQPMDIVVMTGAMRTSDGALRHAPVHVGLVTKPGWLIHTEDGYDAMHVCFRGGQARREIEVRVKEIYRYVHAA
jgi:cell wall-associated NlpC family hydrolase